MKKAHLCSKSFKHEVRTPMGPINYSMHDSGINLRDWKSGGKFSELNIQVTWKKWSPHLLKVRKYIIRSDKDLIGSRFKKQ